MNVSANIQEMLEGLLEGTDCYVVGFKIKPTNNYKIYIDADSGFSIDKCVSINRKLRNMIDEAGFYPDGDYSLEISSPGIDEPLTNFRQYLKNVERLVEVKYKDESGEEAQIIGRLKEVNDKNIKLEVVDKRKKTSQVIEILSDSITKTTVQIEFK